MWGGVLDVGGDWDHRGVGGDVAAGVEPGAGAGAADAVHEQSAADGGVMRMYTMDNKDRMWMIGRGRAILWGVLLLVCAAVVAMWVRSEEVADWVEWPRESGRMWCVASGHGALRVGFIDGWPKGRMGFGVYSSRGDPFRAHDGRGRPSVWSVFGLGVNREVVVYYDSVAAARGRAKSMTLVVRYWLVLVCVGAWPGVVVGRRWCTREKRQGWKWWGCLKGGFARWRVWAVLLVAPVGPLVILCVLWVRAGDTTDAFMIPVGFDRTILVTSQAERWLEFTVISYWPESKIGWWSGRGWKNVGPMKFWQIHHVDGYTCGYSDMSVLGGYFIYPRCWANGPPAYEHSYDRAIAVGYPGAIGGGDPNWGAVKAREIKIEFEPVLLGAFLFALPFVFVLVYPELRARRRIRRGFCRECGYDLRASQERCPECGTTMEGALK